MLRRLTDVPLAPRTSFRIGGVAKNFYAPSSLEELREALREIHARGERPFLLGGGANTLFPDDAYERPVISTELLRGLSIESGGLRAECGVRLNALIQSAIRSGLSGLEGFVGIPGTAGGAVMMNAGGAGWSFGDRVVELGLIPLDGGPMEQVSGADVPWRYRSVDIGARVVAWVRLALAPGDPADIRQAAVDFMIRKAKSQPLRFPSAGCIFRNPPGASAGQWIESLGLKGLTRGGARVSERHANFIVNASGSARAGDVVSLIEEVRERVHRSYAFRLQTEIVLA